MKSIKIPFLGLMLLGSVALEAQVAPAQVKYRRSSLHMIMLDDKGLVNADLIKKTFKGMPIPEKFNDHSLKDRSFDPAGIVVTDADRAAPAKKQSCAPAECCFPRSPRMAPLTC